MKAALLMVTYGDNWRKLSVALDSVYKHTAVPYHLFLICNEPAGKTLELVHSKHPNTTIILCNEQVYWGGAINYGLRMSKNYDYVFFLNDDIEVVPGWAEKHINLLKFDKTIGAVGPLNSSTRDWQGYDNVRKLYKDLNRPELPVLPELPDVDRDNLEEMNLSLQPYSSSYQVVSGMIAFFCVAFSRAAIDKVGELDPDFHELLCGDDDDYCIRLQKAGFKIGLLLGTYIAHRGGFSVNKIDQEKRKEQKAKAVELIHKKHAIR